MSCPSSNSIHNHKISFILLSEYSIATLSTSFVLCFWSNKSKLKPNTINSEHKHRKYITNVHLIYSTQIKRIQFDCLFNFHPNEWSMGGCCMPFLFSDWIWFFISMRAEIDVIGCCWTNPSENFHRGSDWPFPRQCPKP